MTCNLNRIFRRTKALPRTPQSPLKLFICSQTFADTAKLKNQDIEGTIVLRLRKRRKILDSNYSRLLIINKYAPKHLRENLHFFFSP